MSRLFTSFQMSQPKYWSFSFSTSPSNKYSGLISFKMDWFDLLAVQGTLKEHHNSKASIFQPSAFVMIQLSHPYMTTGRTIALTLLTFVGKVMSLLFNTLSKFVIALTIPVLLPNFIPATGSWLPVSLNVCLGNTESVNWVYKAVGLRIDFKMLFFQQPMNHFNSFANSTVCQRKLIFDDHGENERLHIWGFPLL